MVTNVHYSSIKEYILLIAINAHFLHNEKGKQIWRPSSLPINRLGPLVVAKVRRKPGPSHILSEYLNT